MKKVFFLLIVALLALQPIAVYAVKLAPKESPNQEQFVPLVFGGIALGEFLTAEATLFLVSATTVGYVATHPDETQEFINSLQYASEQMREEMDQALGEAVSDEEVMPNDGFEPHNEPGKEPSNDDGFHVSKRLQNSARFLLGAMGLGQIGQIYETYKLGTPPIKPAKLTQQNLVDAVVINDLLDQWSFFYTPFHNGVAVCKYDYSTYIVTSSKGTYFLKIEGGKREYIPAEFFVNSVGKVKELESYLASHQQIMNVDERYSIPQEKINAIQEKLLGNVLLTTEELTLLTNATSSSQIEIVSKLLENYYLVFAKYYVDHIMFDEKFTAEMLRFIETLKKARMSKKVGIRIAQLILKMYPDIEDSKIQRKYFFQGLVGVHFLVKGENDFHQYYIASLDYFLDIDRDCLKKLQENEKKLLIKAVKSSYQYERSRTSLPSSEDLLYENVVNILENN